MVQEEARVAYVQRVVTPRGVRLYFRKGGYRQALSSPDGSDALRDEVSAILAKLETIERAKTPVPGTVGGMIRAYNRSTDFLGLAYSTQGEYQRMLDEIAEDAGDVLLADVSFGWAAEMRDAWAPRGHRAANLRVQMLINALEPAIADGRIPADPFARLKKVKNPHAGAEPNPA